MQSSAAWGEAVVVDSVVEALCTEGSVRKSKEEVLAGNEILILLVLLLHQMP
jgi:hypothetical protein